MAKREALRELQTRLAERMREAREQAAVTSWLAVECRGAGLLFPLAQAGEIFSVAQVMPVPHAASWFAGVANLRGNLVGVVDLAAFLGLSDAPASHHAPITLTGEARLVALGAELGLNVALRVDRLAGLRSANQLVADEGDDAAGKAHKDPAPRPAFAGARWRDGDGRRWQELKLDALARSARFLAIGHDMAHDGAHPTSHEFAAPALRPMR